MLQWADDAKTSEPIVSGFGPTNHILDGVQVSQGRAHDDAASRQTTSDTYFFLFSFTFTGNNTGRIVGILSASALSYGPRGSVKTIHTHTHTHSLSLSLSLSLSAGLCSLATNANTVSVVSRECYLRCSVNDLAAASAGARCVRRRVAMNYFAATGMDADSVLAGKWPRARHWSSRHQSCMAPRTVCMSVCELVRFSY